MPEWIGRFNSKRTIQEFLEGQPGICTGVVRKEDKCTLVQDQALLNIPEDWVSNLTLPAQIAFQRDEIHGPVKVLHQVPLAQFDFRKTQLIKRRFEIIQATRLFFCKQNFIETDTPIMVCNPGNEPYLDAFSAGKQFLRTSPERHMKRLLGMGFQNIFQIGPAFRKGDHSRLHRESFSMLEWYRQFADLNHILDDVQNLFRALAPLAKDPDFFAQPIEIKTCHQLFKEIDIDLDQFQDVASFQSCAENKNIHCDESDTWDDVFFRIFLNEIEPHLGQNRPVAVTDYPASQSALAKKSAKMPKKLQTCYRFEIYVKGIELANAFYELTDAGEQEQRINMENQIRLQQKRTVYPADPEFLSALPNLAPSAGIALGMDRLSLVLLGLEDLAQILAF